MRKKRVVTRLYRLKPAGPESSRGVFARLQKAKSLHRRGQLNQAEVLYKGILQTSPGHFETLHLLGVLALQAGRAQSACDWLGRALETNPSHAEAQLNFGVALRETGCLDEALAAFERALQLNPDYAEAHYNHGTVLQALKRLEEAQASYARALRLNVNYAEAHWKLGTVLQALGRPAEALACYEQTLRLSPGSAEVFLARGNMLLELKRPLEALASVDRALQSKPDFAEAWFIRGKVLLDLKRPEEAVAAYGQAVRLDAGNADMLNNLGNALYGLRRVEDAVTIYERALRLRPGHAEVLFNRGNALRDLKRLQDALLSYEDAIQALPDFVEALINRGKVLLDLSRPAEALACYEQVLRLKPDYAEVINSRGSVLQEFMRLDEAMACFLRASQIKPDYAPAHWNEGLLRLLRGEYGLGFEKYEWRLQMAETALRIRHEQHLLWLGKESLQGKTLLLCAEQGLGDTLQFCRYAKVLAAKGARVLLEVSASLKSLLVGLEGVSGIFAYGDPLPTYDYWCLLLSLPLACGTRLATIPAEAAYLHADPARTEAWQAKLGGRIAAPRIGLAWSGNPGHANDRNRSLPLAALGPLLAFPAQFVSLQKEVRPADQSALGGFGNLVHFGGELADFADTAALIANLDLVISVDTSVAHLAAALGKPVWLLLPFVPDWRWLLDRSDSPWYPSARLFRQTAPGDWGGVIALTGQALAQFLGQPAGGLTAKAVLRQAVSFANADYLH